MWLGHIIGLSAVRVVVGFMVPLIVKTNLEDKCEARYMLLIWMIHCLFLMLALVLTLGLRAKVMLWPGDVLAIYVGTVHADA